MIKQTSKHVWIDHVLLGAGSQRQKERGHHRVPRPGVAKATWVEHRKPPSFWLVALLPSCVAVDSHARAPRPARPLFPLPVRLADKPWLKVPLADLL